MKNENDAQMFITLFGGKDVLVEALGISAYGEAVQLLILERFCKYVFKRVLLCLSHDEVMSMIDVFEAHRASGPTYVLLMNALKEHVPNMDNCVRQEIARAVGEFRLVEATH